MATTNLPAMAHEQADPPRRGWVILDRAMFHISQGNGGDDRYRTSSARARAYRILFALRMLVNALGED